MPLFAGVDVGQSSTTAIIGDERATICGRGRGPAGDEIGQDAASSRLHDAITEALQNARDDARLPRDARLRVVVAGISGYEGRIYGRTPQCNADHFKPVHDTYIAHAGAFGGGPGVIAIAGTGSAVYAADGTSAGLLLGGWGYVFGDEGSAFALVRSAVTEAASEADRGSEPGIMARRLFSHFGVTGARELARAFYSDAISRAEFAAYAAALLANAAEGSDAVSVAIVEQHAIALAVMAATAARRENLVPAPFAVLGGLSSDAWYMARIDAAIADLELPLERMEPERNAVEGALRLAWREGGIAL